MTIEPLLRFNSLTGIARKGAIDYLSIPELCGIDLEPNRKAAVEVVNFNLSGRA
jgi:hypothetical protein